MPRSIIPYKPITQNSFKAANALENNECVHLFGTLLADDTLTSAPDFYVGTAYAGCSFQERILGIFRLLDPSISRLLILATGRDLFYKDLTKTVPINPLKVGTSTWGIYNDDTVSVTQNTQIVAWGGAGRPANIAIGDMIRFETWGTDYKGRDFDSTSHENKGDFVVTALGPGATEVTIDRIVDSTVAIVASAAYYVRKRGMAADINTGWFNMCEAYNVADNKYYVVVSNGTDRLYKWAYNEKGASALVSDTYTGTARFVAQFGRYLVIANVTHPVGGTRYYKRVAWSNIDNITQFETGIAGSQDMVKGRGEIVGLEVIGERCFVFFEDIVYEMTQTGRADLPFAFREVPVESGPRLPRTMANFRAFVCYVGSDNVYAFDGTKAIPIGDKIKREINALISLDNKNMSFATASFAKKKYILFVPSTSTGGAGTDGILFDFDKKSWSIYYYALSSAGAITAAGTYAVSSLMTVGDLTGTVSTQDFTYDSSPTVSAIERLGLAWHGNDGVFVYHEGRDQYKDVSHALTCGVESKDFISPSLPTPKYVSRVRVYFYDVGDMTFSFSYSTDYGATWSTAETRTHASQGALKTLRHEDFDFIMASSTFRFRLFATCSQQRPEVLHFELWEQFTERGNE